MWLSANEIREKFNIQKNAFGSQITSAINTAARRIQLWVDEDVYTEAVAASAPTDADEETQAELVLRYNTVIDAHAFLTMYFLSASVGSKLSQDGFIKEAQDAASVEGARVITNKYLTPAEAEKLAMGYWNEARSTIAPYLTETVAETIVGGTEFRCLEIVF